MHRQVNWDRDPEKFTEDELRILDSENPGLARTARELQQVLSVQADEELEQHQHEAALKEYNALEAKEAMLGLDAISEEEASRFYELQRELGIDHIEDADEATLSLYADRLMADLDAAAAGGLDDGHPMVKGIYESLGKIEKKLYPE